MSFPRLSSWLTFGALLAAVAGGLGWLFFGFAGDLGGRILLLPARVGAPVAESAEVETFADVNGLSTFTDVQALPADAWRRAGGQTIGLRGRPGATGCRITLRNPSAKTLDGMLVLGYFFIDRVDSWIAEPPAAGGESLAGGASAWRTALTGETIGGADRRAEWGREPAFSVEVPAGGQVVVYLRLQDYFGGSVMPEWWPRAGDFHASLAKGLLAEGVYFGALLALLGYNLTLWLRLRFVDTGYYVIYLGMVLAFMFFARGHPAVFGWGIGSPVLEPVLVVVVALAGLSLTQFARVFLELPSRLPRGDRVVGCCQWALGLVAAGALTIPWTSYVFWMSLALMVSLLTHATLLTLAAGAWRTGARQARFFGLSFGCLFAGLLPVAITWWAQIDARRSGIQGVMIGSALEMLLLSLALADRFIQAQTERTAAQVRLVEETERRQALQEAYADELAEEVAERTADLEAANADKDRMLAVIGHDLRSPLAGLTQVADQLAGKAVVGPPLLRFAGDVAQTGRQMLLLIEDIVLWARLRTGAQPTTGLHAAAGVVAPVVALHRPLAERRGVLVAADVPAALTVRTDLVLAQTLVRNLVGNAVKFARTRVDVSARETTGGLCVVVRDDGPGLAPAMVARLSGEAEALVEGGGMGLRLSQEIGVVLGATLAVAPRASGGTEISVTFPTRREGGASA